MMGTYCHLLAGMSHILQCSYIFGLFTHICTVSFPLVWSRLAFLIMHAFVSAAQSKRESVMKNKAPLEHSAIQDTQHVFLYILPVLGYDA